MIRAMVMTIVVDGQSGLSLELRDVQDPTPVASRRAAAEAATVPVP